MTGRMDRKKKKPLVISHITAENGHRNGEFSHGMVNFRSYVDLLEGNYGKSPMGKLTISMAMIFNSEPVKLPEGTM